MNQESQNIEYKESWRDEYLKWICGFANAHGGTLYIGIDDDGNVVGVEHAKRLSEDIPNKIRDVLGIVAEVNLLGKDANEYIEIRIEPSSFPISYKGEYHIRSGSTKQQLKGNALTQFLLRKTGLSWDATEVSNIELTDLSPVAFDIFRTQSVRRKRMDKADVDISDRELLEKLHLFTEDGNLTKAGYLLFARDPEKRIIGSNIKVGYFEGPDIIYQDEIGGSLLEQAQNCVDLIFTKYLKAKITYDGVHRVETFPFPYVAVREAVYNSIAHRAYNYMNSTQIRVYEDKLIISNDASVMCDWTAEKLMESHKSIKYNPLIANTLFKAGFIEIWGRGIEKICNSCIENGNPLPKFELSENDVTVVFEKAISDSSNVTGKVTGKATGKATGKSEIIVNTILANPHTTVEDLMELLNMSNTGVRNIMRQLKADGIIKRVGSDKTGHWEVVDKQTEYFTNLLNNNN